MIWKNGARELFVIMHNTQVRYRKRKVYFKNKIYTARVYAFSKMK